MLPGSVSKYCLQHSPVPVIVVRPSSKRDKARSKRALDPGRHAYKDLLEKTTGGHILDSENLNNFITEEPQAASQAEAAAVAAAIGFKQPVEASSLSQVQSLPADGESKASGRVRRGTASSLDDPRNFGAVMKSPELQNLDSPELSDVSTSEEDDQGGVTTTGAKGAKGATGPLVSNALVERYTKGANVPVKSVPKDELDLKGANIPVKSVPKDELDLEGANVPVKSVPKDELDLKGANVPIESVPKDELDLKEAETKLEGRKSSEAT